MILHLDTHVVVRLYAGDRERFLITAAAIVSNRSLLTRDRTIRDHYAGAFWDDE